jgi:hypothetical protein
VGASVPRLRPSRARRLPPRRRRDRTALRALGAPCCAQLRPLPCPNPAKAQLSADLATSPRAGGAAGGGISNRVRGFLRSLGGGERADDAEAKRTTLVADEPDAASGAIVPTVRCPRAHPPASARALTPHACQGAHPNANLNVLVVPLTRRPLIPGILMSVRVRDERLVRRPESGASSQCHVF